jgi:Leucine-rich repeat (LRR) protein
MRASMHTCHTAVSNNAITGFPGHLYLLTKLETLGLAANQLTALPVVSHLACVYAVALLCAL